MAREGFGPTILEHYRRPRNAGRLPEADVSREGANPLCGDYVRIELALRDGMVTEARFTANACAITTAAASLLTERVRGLSITAAQAVEDGELLALLEATLPVARVRCALLPLVVLRDGLAEWLARGRG